MRKSVILLLFLIAVPAVTQCQLPGVDLTGSISASISAPVPCETCTDIAVQKSAGILIRHTIGIGYRGLRWGEQSLKSDHKMSSDLITLELHLPVPGRVRPFMSGGAGHSSAHVLVSDGGHAYYDYGPASSLATRFWGFGGDIRIYRRLTFTPMISSTVTDGSDSNVHCAAYDYLSGNSSYTCSSKGSQQYAVRGLSVGIGIR